MRPYQMIQQTRRRADAIRASVNRLIRDHLLEFLGKADRNRNAAEFERLSHLAMGNPSAWKFNRDELHERR